MRITDNRLDELVDVFVEGRGEVNDHAAVLLALAELQDRRTHRLDDDRFHYVPPWDFDPDVGDDDDATPF